MSDTKVRAAPKAAVILTPAAEARIAEKNGYLELLDQPAITVP